MSSTAVSVGKLLRAANLTVGLAESCTGGLLCSRLTDVPGSSSYVQGALVAYADSVKERILGVLQSTLVSCGSVSEPVALEMARGARTLFQADIGLAVTGVAGPGGGTPEKPVGLVYIALAAEEDEWCEQHVWDGDRLGNKNHSVGAALQLLQKYLEKNLGKEC